MASRCVAAAILFDATFTGSAAPWLNRSPFNELVASSMSQEVERNQIVLEKPTTPRPKQGVPSTSPKNKNWLFAAIAGAAIFLSWVNGMRKS
jgi:hypothetical protein